MASPMVQVNVRIPPDLHAALEARRDFDRTTATKVVQTALENYLRPNNGETTK